MKKLLVLLMGMMTFAALLFTACEKDEKNDEGGNDSNSDEIAVSEYAYFFTGAWKDSYATRYYCDDNTWYADFDNGNNATGTWDISEDQLTVNYSSGETYDYTIDQMFEDEYTLTDKESGKSYTAELQSNEGCYWLPVEEYEENLPGKWENDYGYTYWFCDDNTFHKKLNNGGGADGVWHFDGNTLVAKSGSTTYLEIEHMSADEFITVNADGDQVGYDLVSSDGCYEIPMGNVVLYLTEDCGCGEIEVKIDGKEVGAINQYIPSGEVDCGDSGALTVELETGTYSVYADCQGTYWEFETTIYENDCTSERLDCSKRKNK
ncbi:MAG: hypothetical protein K9I94_06680 [Bacteroidales bacterium]|nr:hypothetical protein [Bacteroidales bacterium]